jgi:hypothetical protein
MIPHEYLEKYCNEQLEKCDFILEREGLNFRYRGRKEAFKEVLAIIKKELSAGY